MRRILAGSVAMMMVWGVAQAQQIWSGGTISTAGGTISTVCASPVDGDCVKSDLVIVSQGKVLLVRGIYGCKAIVQRIRSSNDIQQAECF